MNNLEFKIDEIKKLLEQGQIEVAMSGIKTLLMQLELKTLYTRSEMIWENS